MLRWKPFTYDGTTYDLSQLHPFEHQFVQPAKVDKPERSYKVQIAFSLHYFTREQKEEELKGPLSYADKRETRTFDFQRY